MTSKKTNHFSEFSKQSKPQERKTAVLRMFQINENHKKKRKYEKKQLHRVHERVDEKNDPKSLMIDTAHHKKQRKKSNTGVDSSVCSSVRGGIQSAWLSIQQTFSNSTSNLIFEIRKDECLDILASVQRSCKNYHQYAQQKLNITNASHLFLDMKKVEDILQSTQKKNFLFDVTQWKKLEEDIQNTMERLFQFLFDYNDDLFALLIYKTKKGHIRSRIPELFFYSSLYSYAQKHLHCNIWGWLKSGIFDSHILRLSNRENPETSKYKEVIFDAMMRESFIFADDTYHKTKKEMNVLSSFRIEDSWSIMRFPITQFIYQDIMGHNRSYFPGWAKPVEMLSIDELFVFCNRLSRKMGFQPVYVPIKNEDIFEFEQRRMGYEIHQESKESNKSKENNYKEYNKENNKFQYHPSITKKETPKNFHRQDCVRYETLLENRKKEIIQSQCTHVYYEVGLYTTWIIDWTSDGYRLPDTHEIILLSVLQQTSLKYRKNLYQSGWYMKNSMLADKTNCSKNEDNSTSDIDLEEEERLLTVLGEKKYRQLSLHETKIAGQKKPTRFDLFDQIGNVADLAIDYSHPTVLRKNNLFFEKENVPKGLKISPSEVESNDLVVLDLKVKNFFYSMGNHFLSDAYKIYPHIPVIENFNWQRPFISHLTLTSEPFYISLLVDSSGSLPSSRRISSENYSSVPYVGFRLVRGRCFQKTYKKEYDPIPIIKQVQLEQLSLPGISVSSQSEPQKSRYHTPRNILEYLQTMGNSDSKT